MLRNRVIENNFLDLMLQENDKQVLAGVDQVKLNLSSGKCFSKNIISMWNCNVLALTRKVNDGCTWREAIVLRFRLSLLKISNIPTPLILIL